MWFFQAAVSNLLTGFPLLTLFVGSSKGTFQFVNKQLFLNDLIFSSNFKYKWLKVHLLLKKIRFLIPLISQKGLIYT